ncbi:MAG: hypothetical protein RR086_06765, partial [Clostridia bacterium]
LSGRALPCQGKCRGSESRFPLHIMLSMLMRRQYFFVNIICFERGRDREVILFVADSKMV